MHLPENVESTIHKVVRRTNAEADPPRLVVDRNGNQVKIQYTSKRNMLSLGVGIVRAIAEHYNERVSISMSNGTTDIKTLVITKG